MEILEEKFENTVAYGTIKFTHTEKGWCWQYDEVLAMSCNEAMEDVDFPPYYVPDEYMEYDSYMPYIEDLEDDCFFETYEEAYDDMIDEMAQMKLMGTIAVWA